MLNKWMGAWGLGKEIYGWTDLTCRWADGQVGGLTHQLKADEVPSHSLLTLSFLCLARASGPLLTLSLLAPFGL